MSANKTHLYSQKVQRSYDKSHLPCCWCMGNNVSTNWLFWICRKHGRTINLGHHLVSYYNSYPKLENNNKYYHMTNPVNYQLYKSQLFSFNFHITFGLNKYVQMEILTLSEAKVNEVFPVGLFPQNYKTLRLWHSSFKIVRTNSDKGLRYLKHIVYHWLQACSPLVPEKGFFLLFSNQTHFWSNVNMYKQNQLPNMQ